MASFFDKCFSITKKIYNNEDIKKIINKIWENRDVFKKTYKLAKKINNFCMEKCKDNNGKEEDKIKEKEKKLKEEAERKEREKREREEAERKEREKREREEAERKKREKREREEERRRIENDIRVGRKCPRCESSNVKITTGTKIRSGIAVGLAYTLHIFGALPAIALASFNYKICNNCGNKFKV